MKRNTGTFTPLRTSITTFLSGIVAVVAFTMVSLYAHGQAPGSYTTESMDIIYEATAEYIPLLRALARTYRVAYEDVHVVMMIECGGCENASTYVSPQGAVGIMQVKPTTAQSVDSELAALSLAEVQERLYDPEFNIEVGVRYFAEQYDRFGVAELAAAAYNGGPQANEHSNRCPGLRNWACASDPAYRETHQYVGNFIQLREYHFGITPTQDIAETEAPVVRSTADTRVVMPTAEMEPFVPTPTFPPTVVAFGDSLTAGVGASSVDTAYPSLLSNWLDLGVINEGISGNTTADGLARINTIIAYDPDVVILFLGGNDILQRVPLQTTVDNLTEIINQLKGAGAHVVLVGVHDSTFQSSRETAFRNLARTMDVFYVPNALRGILGNRSLMADLVHPNDDGYRLLADRIYKVVADALNERYPESPLSLVCEVWPEDVFIGRTVTWSTYSWGAPDTNYTFSWSGDDDLSGRGVSVRNSYATAGTYRGTVTAQADDSTVTRECRNVVTVAPLPLVGHCEVALSSSRSGNGYEIAAVWKAVAGGGTGEYSFSWSGSDGLSGDEVNVRQVYTSPGTKQGTVTVRSGVDTLALPCSITVTSQMVNATSTPFTGGCSVRPGDYSLDTRVTWSARSRGGATGTSTTYRWTGDGPLNDSTLQTVAVTYNATGMKTGTVTISRGEDSLDATCNVVLSEEGSSGVSSRSGCFIATAAYGSAFEPHVMTLRTFRDEQLSKTAFGDRLITYYYAVSPPVAETVAKSDTLRFIVRTLLYPVVFVVGAFL